MHNDLPLNETSLYPGWQSTGPDGGDGGGGEGDGGGLITGLEVWQLLGLLEEQEPFLKVYG